MKKTVYTLFAAILLALSMNSCSSWRQLSYDMQGVDSVSPSEEKQRTMDVVLTIKVKNGGPAFTLKSVEGEAFLKDNRIATFTGGPIKIAARSEKDYKLPTSVTLEPGNSMLAVMMGGRLENITVNAEAVAQCCGIRKKVKREGVKLSDLIK